MIRIERDTAYIDGERVKIGPFISKENFIKFLKKEVKKNRTYKCTRTNCPLAEATGYVVDGMVYGLIEYGNEILGPVKFLPGWAMDFVDVFDGGSGPGLPKEMNANRALYIMEHLAEVTHPDFGLV